MKVRANKQELYECIENAVIRALNESAKGNLLEWYDDDDTDDVVSRFLKNPKNQIPKDKNAAKARKAFMKDREKEEKADEKDDAAAEASERKEMSSEVDESRIFENKVKKAVMEALEEYDTGLNYQTALSAYNKMMDMGQYQRAKEFWRTYNELVNRDQGNIQTNYSADGNTMSLGVKGEDGQIANPGTYRKNYDFANKGENTNYQYRTDDRAAARTFANNIQRMNPQTTVTKNDFIR